MSASTTTPPHPAKFNPKVLATIGALLDTEGLARDARVLDPFAGVGGVHDLRYDTVGVELEPEWAAQHEWNVQGDARELAAMFGVSAFDAIVTSPTYGNRMADSYDGRDGSRRHTYRIALGRELSDGNAGGMQWGDDYRTLHRYVWQQCAIVLRTGGLFALNVSDHVRQGARMRVVRFHLSVLQSLGFVVLDIVPVATQRLKHGDKSSLARVDAELVVLLRLER